MADLGALLAGLVPASSSLSDDVTRPFACVHCGGWFDDYPALVVIDAPEGRLRYCTDSCAEADGWAEAVKRRWEIALAHPEIAVASVIFVPASI